MDNSLPPVMSRIQFRYVIGCLITLATAINYITRVNLNVAMVSMAKPPNVSDHKVPQSVCAGQPVFENSSSYDPNDNRHDWDQETQGIILGSFFWSYVIMQVPAGRFAESYGAKWIIAASLLGSGILNLITPLLSDSVFALTASRMVLGLLQGGVFPAVYAMITRWFPQKERSVAFTFMDLGATIGNMVGSSLAGYLSEHGFAGGWPSIFYVSGLIAVVSFLIFIPFTKSSPESSPYVSPNELRVIRGSTDEQLLISRQEKPPVPWLALLTSKAVLAYMISRSSHSLAAYVNQTKLPAYMSDVLHIHPTQIGLVISVFSVISLTATVASGWVSEWVIQKRWLSRTLCRKSFVFVANICKALCIMLIPLVGCNFDLFLVVKIVENICGGAGAGGDGPVPSELTKNFPGTIFGISNMISTSFGFIAPTFVGLILQSGLSDNVITLWIYIFWSGAFVSILGGANFMIFGDATIQPWDNQKMLDDSVSVSEDGDLDEHQRTARSLVL